MKTLTVTNPQTNEVLSELSLSTEQEIHRLVDGVVAAQKPWARRSLYERSRILYKFADIYESNVEKLAAEMSREMGKPYRMSVDEVAKVPQNIRSTIEYANHMYGQVLPDNDSDAVGDLTFTMREPLGVIGCIIPFNYPVEAAILKSVPALVMGNGIIVKAPSSNPLAVLAVGEMLVDAGVPAELAPYIVCERSAATAAIISNPKVNALSLTGSTETGIRMASDSARCLKPLFLELGGNDPFIICDDADLDRAVQEIVDGRLYNAGQTCCAPKRFLVDRKVCAPLTEKLIERLKTTVVGDSMDPRTDLATLVSEQAAITVEQQVAETVKEGAQIAYGGERRGAYYDPTVLVNVDRSMSVSKDMEIFGPVFPIIAYDTIEEAIDIANQSMYGLNGGVLSGDVMKAFQIARQIEVGSVVVNGHSAYRHLEAAHGGVKMSGLGREGVSTSLEEFSQIKSYVLKGAFR